MISTNERVRAAQKRMTVTVGMARRTRLVDSRKMRYVTNKMSHIAKATKTRNKAGLITRPVNSPRAKREGIAEE
jgi:hypothetical protein